MICKYCGYEMVKGLIICPNCLKNTQNIKHKVFINKKPRKIKENKSSNKKNDEINQWFDMGLF